MKIKYIYYGMLLLSLLFLRIFSKRTHRLEYIFNPDAEKLSILSTFDINEEYTEEKQIAVGKATRKEKITYEVSEFFSNEEDAFDTLLRNSDFSAYTVHFKKEGTTLRILTPEGVNLHVFTLPYYKKLNDKIITETRDGKNWNVDEYLISCDFTGDIRIIAIKNADKKKILLGELFFTVTNLIFPEVERKSTFLPVVNISAKSNISTIAELTEYPINIISLLVKDVIRTFLQQIRPRIGIKCSCNSATVEFIAQEAFDDYFKNFGNKRKYTGTVQKLRIFSEEKVFPGRLKYKKTDENRLASNIEILAAYINIFVARHERKYIIFTFLEMLRQYDDSIISYFKAFQIEDGTLFDIMDDEITVDLIRQNNNLTNNGVTDMPVIICYNNGKFRITTIHPGKTFIVANDNFTIGYPSQVLYYCE